MSRGLRSESYASCVFFFSSRRRHTRFDCDWSSDVCSSDLSKAMVELGGLQQRLGRDAARVQAGAAEGGAAVAVLPLIYAGDAELVLRGADRGRIARRAAADDHDVEGISFVLHVRIRSPAASVPDLPVLP